MLGIKDKNKIITITSELIKTFNPVLYSIDTFCEEKLKDLKYGSLEKITIHQIVYGWYKEKSVLDSFIDNFYQDNASRILRIDMIMYTVIVYLALFRIDELGVDIFKDYLLSQDPSKMIVFVSYLYNEENYNGCLKAEWMKSRDLSYIENDIISKIELFKPYSQLFLYELEQRALGNEAKLAAKDAEIKAGTFGVPQVNKKAITRPRSPNLTKPKLPYIPEPEKIEQIFNKIEYDELIKQENELRADKIRQLKAVNTIHKKTVKIFDPTEISGQGFLDEMSYLEMKSRLEQQQKELIEIENKKRAEWWTQVIDSNDDIGFHWDKDYGIEESTSFNLFPHLGTVTYLSDYGGPTVVLPCRGNGNLSKDTYII
eukprot:gene18091-23740_t